MVTCCLQRQIKFSCIRLQGHEAKSTYCFLAHAPTVSLWSERRWSERVRSFLVRDKKNAGQVEWESRLLHAVDASRRVVGSDRRQR